MDKKNPIVLKAKELAEKFAAANGAQVSFSRPKQSVYITVSKDINNPFVKPILEVRISDHATCAFGMLCVFKDESANGIFNIFENGNTIEQLEGFVA